MPRNQTGGLAMTGNRICAVALTAASAIGCSTASAMAEPFDGNWTIYAQTTRGHCDSLQFGLGISGGRIYATGGGYGGYPAGFGGHAVSSGSVQAYAVRGPSTAAGAERRSADHDVGAAAGRG